MSELRDSIRDRIEDCDSSDDANEFTSGRRAGLIEAMALLNVNVYYQEGGEALPKERLPLEIKGAEELRIVIRDDGESVWIHTAEDGLVLRICWINTIVVDDQRAAL